MKQYIHITFETAFGKVTKVIEGLKTGTDTYVVKVCMLQYMLFL